MRRILLATIPAALVFASSAFADPMATVEARQATFKKIQTRLYDFKGIIKIGDAGIMQAARANVKGFKPFRFPRLYNVWLEG